MTLLRIRAVLLVTVCTVHLTSCIDGNEEVWIEPDGSGRAEIAYNIPASATHMKGGDLVVSEMIRGFLKSTPAISSSTCDVHTDGKRTKIQVTAEFNSALDLNDAAQGVSSGKLPASAISFAGVVEARLAGRTLDFTRTIHPGDALPGSSFLPGSTFHGHRLRYIIHLPNIPSTHNATRVENGGRTLIWDKPLEEAIRSPIVTHFRLEIPIPWKWVIPLFVVLVALFGIVLLRLRKGRN